MGLVLSSLSGLELPILGYVAAKLYSILSSPNEQTQLRLMTIILLIVGIGGSLSQFFVNLAFTKSGCELTLRIRSMSFKSMLRQEIAWHDEEAHSAGILTTQLSSDASALESFAGERIGIIMKSITALVAALIVTFIVSWKLSLVALVFIPWMVIGGMFLNERNNENRSMTADVQGGQVL
ncbi:unnamed protein product [Didymodactylos carnosus]|uniref:ABC transmembrane type-1 domain-containing protein n=1 Tax=Didymodactylos carnosus TaxID=1234261 RepID=A0A815SVW0_9BILA|nr:unnamed protein product [Didymodactylos carnosus]CAF1494933.1 unnamed protein product [Didymodactylos carnosus]CAF4070249.1 unnamed protein product [Didymodactylos carnosus]CAF4357552.1 unnamed protein product [Didymodactylos carnosus]